MNLNPLERRFPLRVELKEFVQMLFAGNIVDGRAGGLIVGRSHADGNIYIIWAEQDYFTITRHLQGGEYVVNKDAAEHFRDRLLEINNYKSAEDYKYPQTTLNRYTLILSTLAGPDDRVLWLDEGQFIVNRHATTKYLAELHDLNVQTNSRLFCDLYARFHVPRGDGSPEQV